MWAAQGEVRALHPRSQAAYADCGTRRGRVEMRGVYPKITPLLLTPLDPAVRRSAKLARLVTGWAATELNEMQLIED